MLLLKNLFFPASRSLVAYREANNGVLVARQAEASLRSRPGVCGLRNPESYSEASLFQRECIVVLQIFEKYRFRGEQHPSPTKGCLVSAQSEQTRGNGGSGLY